MTLSILHRDEAGTQPWREHMEPHLLRLLQAKLERQGRAKYKPRNAHDVAAGLAALLHAHGDEGRACNIRRMGGGASKEQFLFELESRDGEAARLVLRMDPLEGIIETCRTREAQVLNAVAGIVPVPRVAYIDGTGVHMGQPAVITRFVVGVTKPTGDAGGPSGLGILLGDKIGSALVPQYVGNLVAIHQFDYVAADLPAYAVPRPGTTDAALWQVNFWSRVLEDDAIDASPLLAYAQSWLRQRPPICDAPVLLHGDYRLGNFMFDEKTLRMTAILDWELAHIGDFHEDVAYSLEPLFCSRDAQGQMMVAAMMGVKEFLDRYAQTSGREIDPATLHWYRVLNSYKLTVMNFASGVRAARDGTNHQSAFLGYLSACAAGLSATLCQLLDGATQ
jgi:aminoglycoside phosphotransferase (APT) family kinase protein